MLTPESQIAFCHIASSTLDKRLKMSSSESELTNKIEINYQLEPELTEEEIEAPNLASTLVICINERGMSLNWCTIYQYPWSVFAVNSLSEDIHLHNMHFSAS